MEEMVPRETPVVRSPQEILAFAWPPFIDGDELDLLASLIEEAASDDYERRAFMGILGRAYDDLLDLETLYRELPGVLANDPVATAVFLEVLDWAGGYELDLGRFVRQPDLLGLKPIPNGGSGLPCKPEFLIRPPVIFAITQGIEMLTAHDREGRERYIRTVQGLWERAEPLEAIYRLARRNLEGGRMGRLTRHMRILVRDTRTAGSPRDVPGRDRTLVDGHGWPPFPQDPPDIWPPPGVPGRPQIDLCSLVEDACKWLVFGGIQDLVHVPVSTYTSGISGLTPATACSGDQVTITGGGFGAAQPADVEVLVGCGVAPVSSWSDTAIVITIPNGTKSGCVGFRNTTLEAQRIAALLQNREAMDSLAAGLACLGTHAPGNWPRFPVGPSCAPCNGVNFLTAGPPTINWFVANNLRNPTVTPGTAVTLSWAVTDATNVQIRRVSAHGPDVNMIVPASGTMTLSPAFTGTTPTTATYQLTATNRCGSVTDTVTVQLAQPPSLGVIRIEVVQAIQLPANPVRLVERKRTMIRVFVDSGISNGFNNGAGPNLQANVTGRVLVVSDGQSSVVDAGAPLNPGGRINARPPAGSNGVNPNRFDHSLNFELPLSEVSGTKRIEARVQVDGQAQLGPGYRASGQVTVSFLTQPRQELLPILISDIRLGTAAPGMASQFRPTLVRALPRLPLAELPVGMTVNPPLAWTTLATEDLTTALGWRLLLLRLRTAILIAPGQPVGGIRAGMIQADPRYGTSGLLGIGTSTRSPVLDWPSFIVMVGMPHTFVHELTHTLNVVHAPCSLAPGETADPRLTSASIEAPGVDVASRTITPIGTADYMCAASSAAANDWVSIATWNTTFGLFPI